MDAAKDDELVTTESEEDSRVFFSDPHYIHYIGMMRPLRPGVNDCFEMLEHTHFTPGTPRNDLFHLRIVNWMEVMWGIVSIPIAEKELMERVAQINRLRAVRGSPVIIDGTGPRMFPFDSANMFVLENIAGHPIYMH